MRTFSLRKRGILHKNASTPFILEASFPRLSLRA